MLLTVKSSIANIYKKNNKKSGIVTQILLGEDFKSQNKIGNFYKGYKAKKIGSTRIIRIH